jgi:hypothetical protein
VNFLIFQSAKIAAGMDKLAHFQKEKEGTKSLFQSIVSLKNKNKPRISFGNGYSRTNSSSALLSAFLSCLLSSSKSISQSKDHNLNVSSATFDIYSDYFEQIL